MMKISKRFTTTLLAVAVLGTPLAAMAGKQGHGPGHGRQTADAESYPDATEIAGDADSSLDATEVAGDTASSLDATEVADLEFMREEEKLARDVYRTLYGLWGLPVFDNISKSEQVHTTRVEDMIEKYGLYDPVADDTTGVFVNQELADLYQTLITEGGISSLKALYVGAAIEEIDMMDLQHAIDATDNAEIQQLYENLMSGSKNHLRAFVGQIENLGIVYEAQHLPQDEVDSILNSPIERGR